MYLYENIFKFTMLGGISSNIWYAYEKKDCLQLPSLINFSHFVIWELCLALVPYLHSWAGRGLCLGWRPGSKLHSWVPKCTLKNSPWHPQLCNFLLPALNWTTSVYSHGNPSSSSTSSSLYTQNNPLLSLVFTPRGCWSMFWDSTPLFWLSKKRVK